MKKFLFLGLLLSINYFSNAQSIYVDLRSIATTDLTYVVYAYGSSCTVVGVSNPVSIPTGTGAATLNYGSFTWSIDPGTPSPSNVWYFGKVFLSNCVGSTTAGSPPSCTPSSTYYDAATLDACSGTTVDACIQYSASGISCSGIGYGIVYHSSFSYNPTTQTYFELDKH
ncbi:MAG: hypothetical protein H0X33_04215 [Taibaiella sp.]|nr:hypothetical protein [Taibaiella sp.]